MNRLALCLILCYSLTWAADPPKRSKKRWVLSVAALVAAGAADVGTSYGGYEGNPLLRSADGRLKVRGVAIKFGLLGAVIGVERLILRKHPEAERTAVVSNLIGAGALTGIAVRNYRLRSAR